VEPSEQDGQQQMDVHSPIQLGPYELPNRLVMSAMTRNRAGDGNVPGPLNAEYYAQRASAGLIVTEGAQVSPQGFGYPMTPGIHSDEQVAGWRLVTDAVHAAGGRVYLQLWHVGRISHPTLQEGGALPVAPSAIAPEGEVYTFDGPLPFVEPRALELEEIPGLVEQFRQGAVNAQRAGFDGVEIHGATGYVIDQFLRDGANQRTDEYGGSVQNRARLLLEITEAVVGVWGADRVGVKLSPTQRFNSMWDSDPAATFRYAVRELGRIGVSYVHILEPDPEEEIPEEWQHLTAAYFRDLVPNRLMSGGGLTREVANALIDTGAVDLVAFAKLFLANPDLPRRFDEGAALNEPDPDTFYGGDGRGYTDYPVLAS
jgi:N-ethylmaleimide reductase